MRPVQARLDAFQPGAMLVKPFPMDVLTRLLDRVPTRRQSAYDTPRQDEPVRGAQRE